MHKLALDEQHYSQSKPGADDSFKTQSHTVVRDKQTNGYFKQKTVDQIAEYQDSQYIIDQDFQTVNVLLVPLSFVHEIHATYITDIDKRDLARHLKYCQSPETVENVIIVDNVIAQLEPLSVASAATINDQITTLYFDLRDGTDFIEQWISQLFEVAITVNEANQSNIPDVTIEDKHQHQHQHGVIPYKPQVSVIGYNSKKFDMNLLLKHLLKNKTKIQYMGSTTQAKQTVLSHQDYDFDLRFIDKLSFIQPNNTLKQFVEKFGTKGIKLTKGIFPHGSFNYDNYKLVLSQSEAFTKEDFYDKLNNKNISDEDYEQYCNDSINFENIWGYLKHYNIRDVTCMINPINHLIQITWEEKVDMLGYISLAQIASQIKYKYCYDKFDINASYNIVNGFEQFEVIQY
ncbi:MAG: hypothetical protein EZS28_020351 [Streblomastix strix]|uniref:Uncharacterized protein n=1 Tax=Streblomastix strix TaxID=222440 RepID=A0A5J4VPD3_9EUKA|nr:MAG: hypothetical protein EZS28_020351 [Streblomastix strix]